MVDLWSEQLAILNSIRSESPAVARHQMEEARAAQEAAHVAQAPVHAISDEEDDQ